MLLMSVLGLFWRGGYETYKQECRATLTLMEKQLKTWEEKSATLPPIRWGTTSTDPDVLAYYQTKKQYEAKCVSHD